jgi:glutaredoxin-like YruB-family protein
MKKVEIYSTPSCVYCNASKEFFKQNNVEYTEYNVATDIPKRNEMIEKSGQMGVPVILIDGELVVGFDKPRLTELLGIGAKA